MPDYTVTATFQVGTDFERDHVQSLLEQGVRELEPIAARYGFTIIDGSVSVAE